MSLCTVYRIFSSYSPGQPISLLTTVYNDSFGSKRRPYESETFLYHRMTLPRSIRATLRGEKMETLRIQSSIYEIKVKILQALSRNDMRLKL